MAEAWATAFMAAAAVAAVAAAAAKLPGTGTAGHVVNCHCKPGKLELLLRSPTALR